MDDAGVREKLGRLWKGIGKNRYALLVLLLGAVLLLWPQQKKSAQSAQSAPAQEEAFSLENEEARLSSALSRIEGAGKVTVLLSVRDGGSREVASDETGSSEGGAEDGTRMESSDKTVIVSTGSGTQDAVTLRQTLPEYLGAVVVAEGAGSARVRLDLTEAVSAATGLPSGSIKVFKMK